MKGLTTVFRKEVRENIRDRRALFNSLLLGPLLFPLLFVGLMWFLESAERELEARVKAEEKKLGGDLRSYAHEETEKIQLHLKVTG